ncbi:F0F1 ATP synthase subunit alpha, partial [bacterium]|nr:F0F1 ATP synthase subunit alpha [bacterium]
MIRKSVDIVSLLEKAFTHTPSDKIEEIGTVIQVGDGIARVYGLTNAAYGDLVSFEGGNAGMILDLDEDFVSVVAFDNSIPIVEQEIARRDGDILRVPVGES